MSDLAPTEPPGDLLNQRYRLVQAVGQGGMAVVWRAEDELLGRTVAVKILRDQYARDPEFLARFRSEARSAAALNDPGVVGVYASYYLNIPSGPAVVLTATLIFLLGLAVAAGRNRRGALETSAPEAA